MVFLALIFKAAISPAANNVAFMNRTIKVSGMENHSVIITNTVSPRFSKCFLYYSTRKQKSPPFSDGDFMNISQIRELPLPSRTER